MQTRFLSSGTRNPIPDPGIRVVDVHFDAETMSVDLMDGRTVTVPLAWYPRLLNATQKQRNNWGVCGAGYGIHWPDLDEDLSTQGFLAGLPSFEYQHPKRATRKKVRSNDNKKGKPNPDSLRAMILAIMQQKSKPVSAKEIADDIRKSGLGPPSRNLTKLVGKTIQMLPGVKTKGRNRYRA